MLICILNYGNLSDIIFAWQLIWPLFIYELWNLQKLLKLTFFMSLLRKCFEYGIKWLLFHDNWNDFLINNVEHVDFFRNLQGPITSWTQKFQLIYYLCSHSNSIISSSSLQLVSHSPMTQCSNLCLQLHINY